MTIIQKQIFVYMLGGDYDKFLESLTAREREIVRLTDQYSEDLNR